MNTQRWYLITAIFNSASALSSTFYHLSEEYRTTYSIILFDLSMDDKAEAKQKIAVAKYHHTILTSSVFRISLPPTTKSGTK